MKSAVLILAAGLFFGANSGATQQSAKEGSVLPVRVVNHFEFEVQAPFDVVAPLFGPEGEKCWAGKHWNPVFVWPQPAKDVEGAVFTVEHGGHMGAWVNTIFDLAAGRMQYVAVVPEVLTVTVDVRLTHMSVSATRVDVTYARTALDAARNDDVRAMGDRDRKNGPYWRDSIEAHLKDGRCAKDAK